MDSTSEITIIQSISFFEVLNNTMYILLSKRLLRNAGIIIGFVLFLQIVLALLAPDGKAIDYRMIITTVAPLFILGLLAFIYMLIITLIIYAAKKKQYIGAVYTFNNRGLIIEANGKEYSKAWREFKKVREREKHFLLYSSRLDAYMVQKEKLSDSGQLDNFRRLVYDKLN
jgi:hypothetical protein